ncbi:MAG: Mur ligase family protein [Marinilabiliales bacterium]|nr:Mur ligase family protein [Marinilabiliales bacterium]
MSGIAWDHINVFPTFENYCEQFSIFIDKIEENGILFYYKSDPDLRKVVDNSDATITKIGYDIHPHTRQGDKTFLLDRE